MINVKLGITTFLALVGCILGGCASSSPAESNNADPMTYDSRSSSVQVSQAEEIQDLETPIPSEANVALSDEVQPSVESHKIQFSDVFELVSKLPTTSVVVNSGVVLMGGIVFNAPGGSSYFVDQRDPFAPSVILLSDHAQVACSSESQLALIQRETKSASYSLSIVSINAIEDLFHLDTLKNWVAKTRGFMPNAGSTCAFVDQRELIVEGTRLRDSKAPYHGVFTLSSQKLSFWSFLGEHLPKIYKGVSSFHSYYVVMESAYNPEGSEEVQRKDAIYKLNADGIGELVIAAPHLNLVSPRAVVTLSNTDVCFGLYALSNLSVLREERCLLTGEEVTRVRWVGEDAADIYLKSGKHILAKQLINAPQYIELPEQIAVLDVLKASKEEQQYSEDISYVDSSSEDLYLLALQPDLKRSVVELLGFGKLKTQGGAGLN